MSEIIISIFIEHLFQIVASIISIIVTGIILPMIREDLIPFLKEKRLYNIVIIGVQAAEKLAETDQIKKADKKQYVITYLKKKGVTITPEIETFIESVCKEIDLITQETKNELLKE